LIKYQGRTFEFKGLTAEISNAKISLGEFSTKIQNIDSIAETAKALDDFQFNLCNNLSNPVLKDNLTKEDLRTYTKALMAAQACMLHFRSALEAFKQDPKGQRDNLDASINSLQSFVQSVTPELNTEQQRKVVSDAFSSIGIDEKEADKQVIVLTSKSRTKLWSVEDRKSTVLKENRNLETRLKEVITQKLKLQLPNDIPPSISELVSILVSNGIISEKSKEYSDTIMRIGNKVAKGERITDEEYGDYALAIAWFELDL
jgi:hypothetical protein